MVDTRPLNEGLQTLAALSPYVRCVHTPLTGAAATMREATRVILGTPATVSSLSTTDFVFLHLQYLVVVKDLNAFSSSQHHIRSICSPFEWIDACACGNCYGGCCCIGTTSFLCSLWARYHYISHVIADHWTWSLSATLLQLSYFFIIWIYSPFEFPLLSPRKHTSSAKKCSLTPWCIMNLALLLRLWAWGHLQQGRVGQVGTT